MSKAEFTSVGRGITREDGPGKTTGRTEYTYDIELPRMLWGAFVSSPYAHAEIVSIDTAKAEAMSGVHAVLTGDDFPDRKFGEGVADSTPLADGRALFEGQYVAVVAAESLRQAEQATNAITVEYEPLTPVVDVEEAFRTDPPAVVHPDLAEYETAQVLPPKFVEERPNVYQNYVVEHGDVETGFNAADQIYEDHYEIAPVHTCPMEPHVAVARPEGDDSLTIWTSCQEISKIQFMTARILERPPHEVRVIEPYVGGGFGSKLSPLLEPIVGRLAEITDRPVKIVNPRESEFKQSTHGGAVTIDLTTGVTEDGDIVARQVRALLPGGAFSTEAYMVARAGTFCVPNTYSIPHIHVETFAVYTNTPPSGAFRGFGNRQLLVALEGQIDDIARDLDLDPIEFRRRNLLEEGEITALNERRTHLASGDVLDAMEQVLPDGPPPADDPWVGGVGLALINKYSVAPTFSEAAIKVHPHGAIELRYSSDEIGQGSTTAMAQIVAEEFDIPFEDVDIVRGDTDVTPFDQGSISSRSTFNTGNAVRLACKDAKRELFERAAEVMEISPEDLETHHGNIHPKGDPDDAIPIRDVFTPALHSAGYFSRRGGEIIGTASWGVEAGDPEPGKVGRVNSFYSEGGVIAEVRVNTATGQVKVDKLTGVFDVGQAINPRLVEEQIRGAYSMGLGIAFYEELVFDRASGRTINPNYSDYKLPTIHEHPMDVESVILEKGHPEGPYGAKGIGEAPTVAVIPALANAVHDAIGIRIREIPMTPEVVHRHLQ